MKEDTQADTATQVTKQERPSGGSKLALVLSLLALASLGTVLWLAYPHWQGMRQDILGMQQSIQDSLQVEAELKSSLDNARELIRQMPTTEQLSEQGAAMSAQQQMLAKARTAMEQREVDLRITIAELRKHTGKPDNRWMVAEAEYLLQLANLRLQLAGDLATANKAILQAEQRLSETGDDQWTDIRQLLIADAEKLAAVKLPDLRRVSEDISTMIDLIPELQPAFRGPPAEEASANAPTETTGSVEPGTWQSLLEALSSGAQDAISIRRHERMPTTLITPAQERLLYQSLELTLETSRLALVQRDQDLFRDSLQRASKWIHDRFDPQQHAASSMLAKLEQLQRMELAPELPNITPALEALQARQALLSSQPNEVSDQP